VPSTKVTDQCILCRCTMDKPVPNQKHKSSLGYTLHNVSIRDCRGCDEGSEVMIPHLSALLELVKQIDKLDEDIKDLYWNEQLESWQSYNVNEVK
jgi:hypothetical protein